MIKKQTFTYEWIFRKSEELGNGKKKADPILIEKVTKALHLLENLVLEDLQFIFKGGTSLLLIMETLHRFSIDIDIVIEENKHEKYIDDALTKVVEKSPVFLRYEENKRDLQTDIEKAHYKIYYNSIIDQRENYILLDIVFCRSHYSEIMKKKISCEFIDTEEPESFVSVPSAECILGDKLTAFAPKTTGIPFGVEKELEIIKQLFDVGKLFDEMKDITLVSKTFKKTAEQELTCRRMTDLSYIDVLDDIFYSSKVIAFRGSMEKDVFELLNTGVKRIKSYIFSENYILEKAINSASKAAYIALLIKNGIEDFEKFDPELDLSQIKIKNLEYKKFNSIIKFDPEAYFYWYKTLELL